MKRHLKLIAGFMLIMSFATITSCSDPVKDAKDRYEIVKRTGDKREICKKGRELAEAYLAQKNEEEYRLQKLYSDVECQSADLGI